MFLVVAFVVLFVSNPVLVVDAGIVTGSRSVGPSGTTFTVNYAQGCPAQTVTMGLASIESTNTGPNQCAFSPDGLMISPFFCPIDSDGALTRGTLIQDCDTCGCPPRHRCDRLSGVCQACPTLVPCGPGRVDNRQVLDDCTVIGRCEHVPFDVTLIQEHRGGICSGCGTLRQQTTRFTLPSYLSSHTQRFTSNNMFLQPVCAQDVRTVHRGDHVTCVFTYQWAQTGHFCTFSDPICYTDMAPLRLRCTHGVLSSEDDFYLPLARGETRTYTSECKLMWYEGTHRFSISKDMDGDITCTRPVRISGGHTSLSVRVRAEGTYGWFLCYT